MPSITIKKQVTLYQGYNSYTLSDFCIPSYHHPGTLTSLTNREVLVTRDSVHILVYHPQSDSFVFCQQFRPGVFKHQTHDSPMLLECVAGAIESGETAETTAYREVREETGLEVTTLNYICSAFKSPGIMTEKAFFYFAEVSTLPQKTIGGLAEEQEEILIHTIKRNSVYRLMDEDQILDCATLILLARFRQLRK